MHFSGLAFKDNKPHMEQLISDDLWNPFSAVRQDETTEFKTERISSF